MTQRSFLTSFGLSALALLCTANLDSLQAAQDRGSQGRPSAPSRPSPAPQSRPSPAPSRPSAPPQSRPTPPPSRPSPPPVSRPAPAPAPQRPQPPVSRPAPAPEPRAQPQPRYEAPRRETPRAEPRSTPTPRYEAPRSGDAGGSRTDGSPRSTPRERPNEGPRYLPPDTSGRVNDSGRRTPPESGRTGSSSGDNGWHPDGGGSYEFERRTPRAPVPTLSGTPRVESNTPGTPRPGLSSRTGRTPSFDGSRPKPPAEGEGLVRLPRTEVTRESILQRYHGRSADDARAVPSRPSADSDLSRARGARLDPVDRSSLEAERARAARERSAAVAPRGSVEAARRERESLDRLRRLRRDQPERARKIEDAGGALSYAHDRAAQISIGIGVGVATGSYAGWFWEPTCSPHHHRPYSHWAARFGWPWSWYGSYWGWNWPWCWGLSWYNHGWGLSWNSCGYSPYAYGWTYPYSYAYWSPTPVYYTTVIQGGYRDDGATVVYQEPVVEGEGVIAAPEEKAAPAPAAPRETSPEVGQALTRGAAEYLALGDEAFRQGRYSDAVHHYARTVEYAPDDGVLYLLLADALFATGDYHYAAFALRRAIELEPALLDQVVDKHGFYGDPLEFDKQIALAEQYLNEHFLDEDARLVLAANYLFANRPAQCADLLRNPFSQSVLESTAGRRLLERADALRKAAAPTSR